MSLAAFIMRKMLRVIPMLVCLHSVSPRLKQFLGWTSLLNCQRGSVEVGSCRRFQLVFEIDTTHDYGSGGWELESSRARYQIFLKSLLSQVRRPYRLGNIVRTTRRGLCLKLTGRLRTPARLPQVRRVSGGAYRVAYRAGMAQTPRTAVRLSASPHQR